MSIPWENIKNITGSLHDERLGGDIDINGDGTRIVISSYRKGFIQIYHQGATVEDWGNIFTSNTYGQNFGKSIAMSKDGNTVLASNYDSNYIKIFEFDQNISQWEEKQQINGNGGSNDWFGYDIGINEIGNRIIVSSPNGNSSTGFFSIYDKGSDGIWNHSRDKIDSNGIFFGGSVDINASGNRIIVGDRYF